LNILSFIAEILQVLGLDSTSSVDLAPKTTKAKRSSYKKGEFGLLGDWTMSLEFFQNVACKIKEFEDLTLVPEPSNQYDSKAIRVYHKDDFIGFVPKAYSKKSELFNRLWGGEQVYAFCGHNDSWYGDKKDKKFFNIWVQYKFVSDEELSIIRKQQAEIRKQQAEYEDKTEKPYDPNIVMKRNSSDRQFQAYDLKNRGYIENAIEIFESIVGRGYDVPDPYVRLAIIYGKRKEYDKAIKVSQKMVTVFSKLDYYWAKGIVEDGKKRIVRYSKKLAKQQSH
jgi:tetratricopeptide (TPR) repeat protein